MAQTPKRIDIIRDKFIGIESRAYKARHLSSEQDEEVKRNFRIIESLCNELRAIIYTSEEKGRGWGWWE